MVSKGTARTAGTVIDMNLPPPDAERFFRLFRSVLAFVNREKGVVPGAETAEDVAGIAAPQVAAIRDAIHAERGVLSRYVGGNPDGFGREDLVVVGSWKGMLSGNFFVVRYLKKYAVFLSEQPERLYGVLGLADPIPMVLQRRPLPIMLRATLMPYGDRIVWDGLIGLYGVTFGSGARRSFQERYAHLKRHEGILETLAAGGEGAPRTNLDRGKPRRPAPDWRPKVRRIAALAEGIGRADTDLQSSALSLLRASAALAQAALEDADPAAMTAPLRSASRAVTRTRRRLAEKVEG